MQYALYDLATCDQRLHSDQTLAADVTSAERSRSTPTQNVTSAAGSRLTPTQNVRPTDKCNTITAQTNNARLVIYSSKIIINVHVDALPLRHRSKLFCYIYMCVY